jgi:hypothetical protein
MSCFGRWKSTGEIKSSRKKNDVQQQLSMSCNSQFLINGRKGRLFMLIFSITPDLSGIYQHKKDKWLFFLLTIKLFLGLVI